LIARVRETDIAGHRVHGLGRKPSRAERAYRIDPAELAAWNRAQERCKDAYADAVRRADCPLPHNIGGWCACRARRP
jgi:hypothetical protein